MTRAWLLALALTAAAGEAGAQYELADYTDGDLGEYCANKVTNFAAKARVMTDLRRGFQPGGFRVSDDQAAEHEACVRRLTIERTIQRTKRELAQAALEDARRFGLLAPGEGFHIVWTRDGRVEYSQRAAYYLRGRAYPVHSPTVDAAKP